MTGGIPEGGWTLCHLILLRTMPLDFHPDTTSFNAENALHLATASEIAYPGRDAASLPASQVLSFA